MRLISRDCKRPTPTGVSVTHTLLLLSYRMSLRPGRRTSSCTIFVVFAPHWAAASLVTFLLPQTQSTTHRHHHCTTLLFAGVDTTSPIILQQLPYCSSVSSSLLPPHPCLWLVVVFLADGVGHRRHCHQRFCRLLILPSPSPASPLPLFIVVLPPEALPPPMASSLSATAAEASSVDAVVVIGHRRHHHHHRRHHRHRRFRCHRRRGPSAANFS
jgi:hypothetical protein